MVKFKEFMSEEKLVNRWFILRIALVGAFAGALLAVAYLFTVII